jgi:hypothetical protein
MVGLPAYLLGNQEVRDAMFLPEILFLLSSFRMQHFKPKPAIGGKLLDGIFPLTFHAHESMSYV